MLIGWIFISPCQKKDKSCIYIKNMKYIFRTIKMHWDAIFCIETECVFKTLQTNLLLINVMWKKEKLINIVKKLSHLKKKKNQWFSNLLANIISYRIHILELYEIHFLTIFFYFVFPSQKPLIVNTVLHTVSSAQNSLKSYPPLTDHLATVCSGASSASEPRSSDLLLLPTVTV